jgi:putative membrane protein
MKLNETDKSEIRRLTRLFEERTGTQILAVVAGKSDNYPEIPWRAFSMGTAFAALGLLASASLWPGWLRGSPVIPTIAALGAGLVLAIASIFVLPVARLFAGRERKKEETRQYAQSLFLERGLGRTASRIGVLMLVSQFERRGVITADAGILDRVQAGELEDIEEQMSTALTSGSAFGSMAAGIGALEKRLLAHGFATAGGGNEISGEFLEMEGPQS